MKAPAGRGSVLLAGGVDGETLVISGFTWERAVKESKTRTGVFGGTWFSHGTVTTRKRVELVILLTAKIVAGVAAQ